jgi:hypothetical protein
MGQMAQMTGFMKKQDDSPTTFFENNQLGRLYPK